MTRTVGPMIPVRTLALALVAVFAFPFIGQQIPYINRLPGNLISYMVALTLPAALCALAFCRIKLLSHCQLRLLTFFGYCTLLSVIKISTSYMDWRACMQYASRCAYPFVLSGLTCLSFSVADRHGERQRFVNTFVLGMIMFVVLQFLMGISEARGHEVNPRHASLEYALDNPQLLARREIFKASLLEATTRALGFTRPFCGGFTWYNDYGVMIAIINLLILVVLTEHFRWLYAAFVAFLFLCALASTTKVAIGSILFTDVIFVYAVVRRLRRSILLLVTLAIIIAGAGILSSLFYDKIAESWLSRVDLWQEYARYLSRYVALDPLQVFFGPGATEQRHLESYLQREAHGTENELLVVFVYFGLAGVLLYVVTFGTCAFRILTHAGTRHRIMCVGLLCVLLLCGATMDCLNRNFTLPIITVAVLCLESSCSTEERSLMRHIFARGRKVTPVVVCELRRRLRVREVRLFATRTAHARSHASRGTNGLRHITGRGRGEFGSRWRRV